MIRCRSQADCNSKDCALSKRGVRDQGWRDLCFGDDLDSEDLASHVSLARAREAGVAEVAAPHLLAQLVLGGEVAVVAEALIELPLHLTGAAGAGPVLRDRDLDRRLGRLRRGGRRTLAEPARQGRLDVLGRGRRRERAAEEAARRGRRGRRRRRDAFGETERAPRPGAARRRGPRRRRPGPAPARRPRRRRPPAPPPAPSPSSSSSTYLRRILSGARRRDRDGGRPHTAAAVRVDAVHVPRVALPHGPPVPAAIAGARARECGVRGGGAEIYSSASGRGEGGRGPGERVASINAVGGGGRGDDGMEGEGGWLV